MSTTTKTAIPKLRFPEFEQAGAWDAKTLGDITNYESSALAQNKLEIKSEGFPVYGASGLVGYIDTYAQPKKYVSMLKDGSGVGRISLNPEKSSVLGTLGYIIPKDYDLFNINWVHSLLQTIDFSDYVKGQAIPHVYYSDYSKHKIFVPTLPEQEKIAATLCSLDELIAANNAKLEALKIHKQGLMQQLFPAPGEKVPRLRFPEFTNAGDWEEKSLGEVAEINPKSKDIPNEFVYIDLESVETGKLKNRKIIQKAEAPSRAQRLVKKNDILFQMVRSYQQNNLFIDFEDEYSFVASSGYAQIRTKQNSLFLYYSLHTSQFLKSVIQQSTGSSYPAINTDQLAKLVLLLPNINEQRVISATLASCDKLIHLLDKKNNELRTYKKGLMSNLFPTTE